jgi:hypothetical protein
MAMAESAAGSTGRIFISYRRDETAYPAGWLFDRLAEHFGPAQVFKDVDSIELGDDFVQVITRAVGSCDVLLALIGDEWLTITDEHGRRRLDDPHDFVRLEIQAALTRNVRIVPILVDGARMPHADELPADLVGLVHRQALELSPSRFEYDTSRLIKVLDTTLANVRTALDDAAAISTPAMSPHLSTSGGQRPPDQLEPTSRGGRPNVPPPAPATPGGDRPLADQTKPPEKQSRSLSRRARVLTGVGAGTLILLLIVAIAVYLNNTKPAQTGTVPSTSSPKGQVIFQDDFASRANKWDDAGRTRVGGHYTNEAYRIYAEPDASGAQSIARSAPRKPSSVYPSAPLNLHVEVDAKALALPQNTAYGLACRAGSGELQYGYVFNVGDDYLSIAKYDTNGDFREIGPSHSLPSGFKMNASHHLEADCRSDEGDQAVHLVFTVNGLVIAEETDSENPLTGGTVALFAVAFDNAEAVEVEFDNFVVQA